MTNSNLWRGEHSIETSASKEAIWRLFSDVNGWKRWNAGIERIEMKAPFAVGSEFFMQPPGQDGFISKLIWVVPNAGFTDETRVGDLTVRVEHRIERVSENLRRVVYAIEAQGPGCEEIGPAVSADFPDVLRALVALAVER
jgi:hypothetical protein